MRARYNKSTSPKTPAKEQGAALLIALVIMSIAMGIAVNIMFRQQLHTRLAVNISNLEQLYPYATGLEDFSRTILARDFQDAPKTDNLSEIWAKKIPPIPIPGGAMTGHLVDLQAKLNLNNLIPPTRPISENPALPEGESEDSLSDKEKAIRAEQRRYSITKSRVTALLKTIDPDTTLGPAVNFSDLVTDWIDSDSTTRETGAESDYYQALDPPYNASNSNFASISELRLLRDIDKKAFTLLKKHLAVLPEITSVNVNTASAETLQALGFTPDAASEITNRVKDTPFETLQEFLEMAVVQVATEHAEGTEPMVHTDDLSVTSSYFLLQGEVNIGTAKVYINSILHRKDDKVMVISRDFSNQQIVEPKE